MFFASSPSPRYSQGNTLEDQPNIVTTVSTNTEESSKVENVETSLDDTTQNNDGSKDADGGAAEDQSQSSKEDSKTTASTRTTHKRNSPTLDAMTMSGSGTSSPTQMSEANRTIADSENQHHDEQDEDAANDDTNADDDGKASWESGVSNLSASSFITVKFLVSNNMAGSIIGRAGETINELQLQSSSRIKLGQSGDYYPGTSERACLVHGSLDNVKKAATLLLQKLYDLQLQQIETQLGRQSLHENTKEGDDDGEDDGEDDGDNNATKDESAANVDEQEETPPTSISFSVRLLIPSASCGMLIGRSGTNIKKIKETSQVASIRLASKADGNSNMHFSSESMAITATSERILTITGNELNSCLSCAFLILDGFARHPDICRYANNTTSYSKIPSTYHTHYNPNQMGYPVRTSSGGSIPSMSQHRGGRSNSYIPVHHSQNSSNRMQSSDSFIPGTDGRRNQQQMYQNVPHVNAPLTQVPAGAQPPHMYNAVPGTSRQRQNAAATQDIQKPLYSETLSISDSMIGAILGKRGQTLNYLQNKSGTKIKISQRGDYIPGTNNRIVTVSGPNSQSVATAKNLIHQQLARNSQDRTVSNALPQDGS